MYRIYSVVHWAPCMDLSITTPMVEPYTSVGTKIMIHPWPRYTIIADSYEVA